MTRKCMALFLICLLFLFAGCGAKSGSAASAGETADMANTVAQSAPAEPAAIEEIAYYDDAGGVYQAGNDAAAAPQYGGHKVIATYSLEMISDAFDDHYARLLSKAEELGGYVQEASVNGTKPETYHDSGRFANLIFRIPADKAEEFVNYAGGTGEITYNRKSTEDVTLDYYDSETRLEVLKTQLERLQSILVETDNLADIIELERAISEVTIEIEQMTTQLRRYDNLIDYSTVYVDIQEKGLIAGPAATKTIGERISEGFRSNLSGVGVFLEDAFVWFISSLPVLLLLAAIGVGIWLIVRSIRRSSQNRKKTKEKLPPWQTPEKEQKGEKK